MLPWDRPRSSSPSRPPSGSTGCRCSSGALVRNFITPEAVNDRLFSLLSFLHIGLPLGVLGAALGAHAARAAARRRTPPRPIWIGVTRRAARAVARQARRVRAARQPGRGADDHAARLVLPAGVPAASTAGRRARCGRSSAALTLLLVLLPWLPPKRTSKEDAAPDDPPGQPDHPGRDPARRSSTRRCAKASRLPYDCRNGGCGQCKCTLLYGTVDQGPTRSRR